MYKIQFCLWKNSNSLFLKYLFFYYDIPEIRCKVQRSERSREVCLLEGLNQLLEPSGEVK